MSSFDGNARLRSEVLSRLASLREVVRVHGLATVAHHISAAEASTSAAAVGEVIIPLLLAET